MKRQLALAVVFLSFTCSANSELGKLVVIEPIDCGPLARKEFGVVFSAMENGKRKTYFAKGKARKFCPKLFAEKEAVGIELDLCLNYQPENPNECNAIKEFKFD